MDFSHIARRLDVGDFPLLGHCAKLFVGVSPLHRCVESRSLCVGHNCIALKSDKLLGCVLGVARPWVFKRTVTSHYMQWRVICGVALYILCW